MDEPNPKSPNKHGDEFNIDPQLIVEEKIVKENGEILVKKYLKGRYLGKVF